MSQLLKLSTILIVLLLLLLGGFLRFYNLGNQSYWIDESYSINSVLSVLEKGVPILDSGKWYHSEIYAYPTALATKVFGNNSFAYRFWPAVFGVLFIFVIFIFVKELFGVWPALLSSFFITFSYWQIAWSRQARWYTMWEVFFWLALFFFYKAVIARSEVFRTEVISPLSSILLTIFFTILAIVTHKLGILLLLFYAIWFLIQKKKKQLVWGLLLLVLAVVIDYLFFGIIRNGINQIDFNFSLPYYLGFTIRNYWLFLLVIGIGIIGGFYEGVKSNKLLYVTLPFLIYFLVLSFLFDLDNINYRYLFHIYPALIILGSAGLAMTDGASSLRGARRRRGNLLKFVLALSIILFFISGQGVLWPKDFYYLESDDITKQAEWWRNYYPYTPQPDFNNAYDYIKQNWQEGDIIISAYPQFDKLFLNRSDYWLRHNLSYFKQGEEFVDDKTGREYYVGAKAINNFSEFKLITNTNNGFIVFDFMSIDGRVSWDILDYINRNYQQVFFNEINPWSKIWVYRF